MPAISLSYSDITIRGITYSKGSKFTCYSAKSGKSTSEGANPTSTELTEGQTYYVYCKASASTVTYPYAVSTSSGGSPIGWYTEDVFPYKEYAVSYSANGGKGAPSTGYKKHGVTYKLSSTVPTRTGYTFKGWATSSTATKATYAAGASYTSNAALKLYAVWELNAPADPSNLSVTRENDNKNTLTWENGENASVTYESVKIERKTDGGSWSEIASVSGAATSYSDTTTAADHFYEYRIRACNATAYSDYATCSTVLYNTPSAPTNVALARLSATKVYVEITNPAVTATALELQRSTDRSTWETVATIDGSPVTSTTDEPGGGTFYYRARNTRGDLVSDWSPASNAIVTICAPAAPTLIEPVSSAVVSKATGEIRLRWAHNAIDGSAQTAAKLRYSLDKGATWVEAVIDGSTAYCNLKNIFAVNTEITWRVCTKGVHEDYGPWSGSRTFYVRQQPSVAFSEPSDGFIIENVPVHVDLQYDDASGVLANATLNVSDGARDVYTRNMGTDTSCDILASEWLPEDGKTYTLTVSVRSSSTLTASATREVEVKYILPKPAVIDITPDPETGYTEIFVAGPDRWDSPRLGSGVLGFMVLGEEMGEFAEVASISIYRVHEGQRVILGEGLQVGASVIDKYAPLNVDYSYEAVSFAETGASNVVPFATKLNTPWWFVYYDGGMAKAMWDPSGNKKPRRTKDELKERDGREWPVLIQGRNKSLKVEFSGWVNSAAEEAALEDMTFASGGKVYKGLKGEVFHCHAEADIEPTYQYIENGAKVKVSIIRVSGGVL